MPPTRLVRVLTTAAILLGAATLGSGCTSNSTTASSNRLTANVGQYPAAPAIRNRPRVGIPAFEVSGPSGGSQFNDATADVATTLAFRTGRFDVIERAQLQTLLAEQGLEGIVRPGELARSGEVRGVDYLLIGRITDFRVRTERTGQGFSLGNIANVVGGVDTETRNVEIRTEAGVDLRLVDPATGAIVAARFSDFSLSDKASSVGVQILGASATSEADLDISRDDKGKLLRLAVDDALRRMLPDVDEVLIARDREIDASGGGAGASPAGPDAATASFCTNCGGRVAGGARFCPACGTAVGG
jgi:curli biogenesis system outer membrane secretion channel CsgG